MWLGVKVFVLEGLGSEDSEGFGSRLYSDMERPAESPHEL